MTWCMICHVFKVHISVLWKTCILRSIGQILRKIILYWFLLESSHLFPVLQIYPDWYLENSDLDCRWELQTDWISNTCNSELQGASEQQWIKLKSSHSFKLFLYIELHYESSDAKDSCEHGATHLFIKKINKTILEFEIWHCVTIRTSKICVVLSLSVFLEDKSA